jgi:hypothetical protein
MTGAREYREKSAHAVRLEKEIGPGDVADQLNALAVIHRERASEMERTADRYPDRDVAEEQQQQQPQPGPKTDE